MKKRIFILVILGIAQLSFGLRANPVDSIEQTIASLKGNEKLAVIDQYCRTYFQTDPDYSVNLAQRLIHLSDTALSYKALGYKYMGVIHYFQAQYDVALLYYDTAYSIYYKQRDIVGMAAVLNNRGIAYMEQGIYDKALDVQLQAYKLNLKDGNPANYCKNLINIANIYSAQKNDSKALEYGKKALAHLEKEGESQLLADVYNNVGASSAGLGQLKEAHGYYLKSLAIRRHIDDRNGIATSYANLGNVSVRESNYKKAINYYQSAIAIFEELNNPRGLVSTLNFCAEAYMYLKDLNKSEALISRALEIANAYNLREIKPDILTTYKVCALVKGDYQKAYQFDQEYRLLSDSLNNEQLEARMANLEATYQAAEKERQLQKITIEKERQMQLWAWIVTGLSTIILLFALFFTLYRSRNKQKTILLANQKAMMEVQLLRSQMNPHFIFNSLSSIQSYILQNKSEQADAFLSKFARLMRLVLHHSAEEYVVLDEELESIRLYLDLERNRFNNRFDYQLIINDSLDTEAIKVPPMLMQPFIENALIHGLLPKTEAGHLVIHISMNDCCLLVEITDNGIGREQAQALQQGHTVNHKSVGLSITRQRLAMLNAQTTNQYQVKIDDLQDANGTACGTKVTITMPWITL